MSKQYAKLIMVSRDNNNKYYEMFWDGISENMQVKYGRVESTAVEKSYSHYEWDRIYREKTKKGYKDVTEMVSVEVKEEKTKKVKYTDIKDKTVANFIAIMKKYTDGLVSKTYSVKSDNVTQKQVDEAQRILDSLADLAKAKKQDTELINTRLIELYMIIPRYIKDVRTQILPHINLEETLDQEQNNLDAMASQVNMNTKAKNNEDVIEKEKEEPSILDMIGVKMKPIDTNPEIEYLMKQVKGKKIESVFEIKKSAEDERFQKWLDKQTNKTTKIILHGTKCTSVIPILEQGLKIRPTGNFQFSGKVYGNGNYFSEQYETSIGYTDNGYARSGDSVLLVYEVHVGKPSYTSANNYDAIRKMGADSFAMKGSNGLHTMRVAYKEEQAKIKYAIWLK